MKTGREHPGFAHKVDICLMDKNSSPIERANEKVETFGEKRGGERSVLDKLKMELG